MAKNYGIKDIESWKFKDVDMPKEWVDHLGDLSKPFKMLILGEPKNGKTEYALKLSKMLANYYGKVSYNSPEQGKSKTFALAVKRNDMGSVSGKFVLLDKSKRTFAAWFKYLEGKNTGSIIFLDSVDYMHLTFEQWQQLTERFPNKSFVVIAWNKPKSSAANQIEYTIDILVTVKDYVANVRSRFGGNKPFVIWAEGAKKLKNGQPSLFGTI